MITRIIDVLSQKILLHRTGSFFHEFSQLDIFGWQSSAVMGGQSDLDFAVNIKPFRVMIHLLWQESNTSHKPKCLVKILKFELLINGITTLDFNPPWRLERLKVCFPFLCSKFGGLWWRLTTTRTENSGYRKSPHISCTFFLEIHIKHQGCTFLWKHLKLEISKA